MPLIFQIIFSFLTLIFTVIDAGTLSQIEQTTFESRVKHAETILFGRFNWAVPINTNDHLIEIHSFKQNTFEFTVYCTIKKSHKPDNVPRSIAILIDDDDIELDMKKNTWFILFPREGHSNKNWIVDNRTDAFDLEDDLELRIFEQFCFLKPKLPIGFPSNGLLNRCPKPSAEHCLKNGTKIAHDELLELKTFLTSTTTRKAKVIKPKSTKKPKRFIEPVW